MKWKIDEELRSILVCPICKGDLNDRNEGLLCKKCEVIFPVIEDVPYLIVEEVIKQKEQT